MDTASVVSGRFGARGTATSDATSSPAPLSLAAELQGCTNDPESPSPLLTLPPEILSLTFAKLDLGSLLAVSQAHPRLQEPVNQR